MSWSGPRKVKEPSPPNRKPGGKTLTKTGKKLKEKVRDKNKFVSRVSDKRLKEIALQKHKKETNMADIATDILLHPGSWIKYSDKTLKQVFLHNPRTIFAYAPKKINTFQKFLLENKNKIIKYIGDDYAVILYPDSFSNKKIMDELMTNWVIGTQSEKTSHFLRTLVGEEFGLKSRSSIDLPTTNRNKLKGAIRDLYNRTQKQLKKDFKNQKNILLYRGIKGKQKWKYKYSLVSYTSKKETAEVFSGVKGRIKKDTIPFNKVLSYPKMSDKDGLGFAQEWLIVNE